MADIAKTKASAKTKSGIDSILRWRGIAANVTLNVRVGILVAIVISIIAMSITHLGMYHLAGSFDSSMAVLRLTVVSVAIGALLFGTLGGTALGTIAGVVAWGHAELMPADFYEKAYIGPLDSIIPFLLIGFAFGIAFALASRCKYGTKSRIVAIIGAAAIVSVTGSVLFYSVMFFQISNALNLENAAAFLGVDVAAIVVSEALVIAIACVAADRTVLIMTTHLASRGIRQLFQGWLLLVTFIVFMIVGTAQFIGVTSNERAAAANSITGEINYIDRQLNSHNATPEAVLDGYDIASDGVIYIISNGLVMATTDTETPVGSTVDYLFGYEETGNGKEDGQKAIDEICATDEFTEIDVIFEDGHTEFTYLMGRHAGNYYILTGWPASKVYADRPAAVGWTTLASLAQLIAVFLLATLLLSQVVVRRIDETNETLERITEGNLDERVNVRDSKEFSSLSAGINSTVSALKDTIEEVEHRNAQDLATAKAIQESTLPREFPPFPDIDRFDIYASMKTAKEVGGDFYDFFIIEEGSTNANKLGFVMADVSGKGIPAALFMMTAKTQIRNYLEAGLPVNEAVDAANHQLCIGNDAGMFVTAWVGMLDYETGMLSYANAGHNPPMLLNNGNWEWMKSVSGMPLGLFDGIPYDRYERQLQSGSMLYTYTDGVTEAMDVDGNMFGEARLKATLEKYATFNPRSVGVGVRRALTDFTLDADQSDDITMLILKYGVPPEKRAVMILPADDKQLVHVYNFIHEELRRRSAPKSVYNPLDIAAEELFVNVCHYAYPDATPENPGEVRISFEYEANPPSLTVTIADNGIPYNPLDKPDAVTPDNIDDVPIGGLGILMAKRSVDEMTYARVGCSNELTFKKGW